MLTTTFGLSANPVIDNFVTAFLNSKEKMVEKFSKQILDKVALHTDSLIGEVVFSKSTNGTEQDLTKFCIDVPVDDLDIPEYLYFEVKSFFSHPYSALDGKYHVLVTPYPHLKKITVTIGEA